MKTFLPYKPMICCVLFAIGLLSVTQPHAQTIMNEKAIMAVVDISVKEYRVYATCMSLDELSLSLVKESWNKSRSEALQNLKSDGASLLFIGKFAIATDYSKVFDPNMKLSEAMSFCYKNKDKVKTFYEFGNSHLEQEIEQLQKSK